jgi:hypothetical protein
MNHYVSLSLTNRKSSVHLCALYSQRTGLRTFTPRRDQFMICGQYVYNLLNVSVCDTRKRNAVNLCEWLVYYLNIVLDIVVRLCIYFVLLW